MPLEYLDFDLAIEKHANGYRAHVLNWQGAQAAAPLTLALTDDEINAYLTQLGFRVRGAHTASAAAKAFGQKLFDALFQDDVRVLWKTALTFADAQNKGVRLHLRLSDTPELADLPWELLYDARANTFLNLSYKTPLVRFLEMADPPRRLQIEPPLRILGILSLPDDYAELSVEREWAKLQDALKKLSDDGLVELTPLQDATPSKLQELLRQQNFHILHFIGHGERDPQTNQGALVFENERGRGRLVSGERLGALLRDANSLRLVVLNACEGARPDRADPFGGVAQRLVQQTIPAVIAMQFEITDRAARAFAQEFYAALADNFPIEAALGEARKAIYGLPNETEWATPVLYSRSLDGMLFDLDKTRPRSLAPTSTPTPTPGDAPKFEELLQRAERSRAQGELILSDTPVERQAWLPKFQAAEQALQRALQLQPDNARALLALLQTQARLAPENPERAKATAQQLEQLLFDATDAREKRILAQTYLLHATLTNPPNERLLERAGQLYLQSNDPAMSDRVHKMLRRVESASFRSLADLYGEPDLRFASPAASAPEAAFDFNPLGKWDFQIKDELGSRMTVEFSANGSFQMTQRAGLIQVPINGTWLFNSLTQNLALQGVINAFQAFTLNLTLTSQTGDAFTAVSESGVTFLLTRA